MNRLSQKFGDLLRLKPTFWLTGSWKVWLILFCFLGELPWILLMDHSGSHRQVYGWNLLRINVADMLRDEDYSRNIFGWLVDLDKIIPYSATLILFFIARKKFYRLYRENSPRSIEQIPYFPLWVTAFGLYGAFSITAHYITSTSGHYTSYLDKGILDAFEHLRRDSGAATFWFGLFGYRLTYLLLSPFVYFVLFATTAAAATLALQEAKLYKSSNTESAYRAGNAIFFLFLTGLPAGILFVFHSLVSAVLQLGNYAPSGYRLYILYGLYVVFIFTAVRVVYFLRKKGYRISSAHLDHASGSLSIMKSRIQTITSVMTVALVFLPPIQMFGFDIRSPALNLAINKSAVAFVQDYKRLPAANKRYDKILNYIIFDRHHDIFEEFGHFSERGQLRALMLSLISLEQLDIRIEKYNSEESCSGDEVKEAINGKLNENYEMFSSNRTGSAKFRSAVIELCQIWYGLGNDVLGDKRAKFARKVKSKLRTEGLNR